MTASNGHAANPTGSSQVAPAAVGKQLFIPQPPTFDSVDDERYDRKVRLAAAFRMFSRAGVDEGVAGHITVRDPAEPDSYWVNPFGMHFSLIRQSDLVRVSHDGEVVEGNRAVNGHPLRGARRASRNHRCGPRTRPVRKTLSSLEMTVEPLTQDACAFYDDVGVHDTYTGVVLDPAEGRRIGEALGDHKAVILRNHGMLTVGTTVDSAAWWFLTLERTSQCQLMAYSAAAGAGTRPRQIGHDEAIQTRGQVGFELAGWFQFQPIFERISKDSPDIFD